MSRELIIKYIDSIEEAIGAIEKQCFLRSENAIQHLPNNEAKVYTRDYVFWLKLAEKQL